MKRTHIYILYLCIHLNTVTRVQYRSDGLFEELCEVVLLGALVLLSGVNTVRLNATWRNQK